MLPKRMSSNASTVEKSLAPWGHRTLGRDSWWGLNSKSTGLPCLGSGAPGGTFRRGAVIDGLVASGCGSRTAVRVSSLLAARQGMSPLRSMILESGLPFSLCRANVYYVNYSGRRSCDAGRPRVGHDSNLPTYKPTPVTRPDPTREVSEPRATQRRTRNRSSSSGF